ncbi:hypothetical protein B6I21_02355 [candidate division KSB1 bacterium 4572_119]|nr:MAG: hypothetical protein B6I21_02355 [candidate division KSB1 bacterium 4572_119]
MSRLVTNFQTLLKDDESQNKSEIAKRIGVSRVTFYSLFNDNWKQIQRETIEKVCDYFKCDISQLFEIKENPFWIPFLQKGSYSFIFGGARANEKKSVFGSWDLKVMNEITAHLNQISGKKRLKFNFMSSLEFEKEQNDVIDYIKENNTIIIGSPKANPLSEFIIANLYNAEPLNPEKSNRKKIPFRFIRPQKWGPFEEKSAVTEASQNPENWGIHFQKSKKNIAKAEWFDRFYERKISKGHDCGLLIIVNKPFETQNNVKLIILAGYSGLSSFGLAEMLTKDSNKMEPKTRRPLAKVVQFEYDKPSEDRDDRKITKRKVVAETQAVFR